LYAPFINICRYLQISADIADASRYLVTSEISSRDLITADKETGKEFIASHFCFVRNKTVSQNLVKITGSSRGDGV
jgi:hypothetical protein